ncbi:hypothetical protein [Kitasatospora kazusensis]
MTTAHTVPLSRPVRGVQVRSRQTVTACVPTYGRVELDFEPLPEGAPSSCEFDCTPHPERAPEYEAALARGVLQELAAGTSDEPSDETPGAPEVRRSGPVGARVVVRDLSWHWTDSCEPVFTRLGVLAVREALSCAAAGREPEPVVTRVRLRP